MPLIAHNQLPAYARLASEGQILLGHQRATHQDIRELHIGLLNMMPDAALEATERQFLRLVGGSNRIAQFYVHLFTLDGLERGPAARAHIDRHYERFDDLAADGLDALIVTGANITGPDLTQQAFFAPMAAIVDWARDNVTSVLCSCLASHAIWKHHHGIDRRRLDEKVWGVFEHRTIRRRHPVVSGVNTRFHSPHSRYNDVSREQIETAGMTVLTASDEAGVLLATSADGLRFVYVQGHPEYDIDSLSKEYKREVLRYADASRDDYPQYPAHYFGPQARALLDAHRDTLVARRSGVAAGDYPEAALEPLLDNTWIDTGKAIVNNWLGLVYQTTGQDRRDPFMADVDPGDPLGLSRIEY